MANKLFSSSFLFCFLKIATVTAVRFHAPLTQKNSCSDWSEWSDYATIRKTFVEIYGEIRELPKDGNVTDECSLLNLEEVIEVASGDHFYVALAGGTVGAIAIVASVTATYIYSRHSQ